MAAEQYRNFLRTGNGQKILFPELGEAFAPDEIKERSVCISGDVCAVLGAIKNIKSLK